MVKYFPITSTQAGTMTMSRDLRRFLQEHMIENRLPRGEVFLSVREEPLVDWSRRQGLSLRRVMIQCLEQDIWPERLRPNRGAFAAAEQARLLDSAVAVIGAGGLGGMVILQLARFGVGRLAVCDGDVFDQSNLNRQFLSRLDRLGRNKALCAQEEVAAINPAVEVVVHDYMADAGNLPRILAGARVVVDCLDTLAARYTLEAVCQELKLPYVHGSVAGLEGLVMTVMPGDPGLRGLYGPRPAAKEDSAEVLMGVPTMTPALVAGLQVNEVAKLLLDRRPLRRRMLHLDLESPSLEVLELG